VDLEARLMPQSGHFALHRISSLSPASFKRIRNILVQAGFTGGGAVVESLLEPGPELELYQEFTKIARPAYRERDLETAAQSRLVLPTKCW